MLLNIMLPWFPIVLSAAVGARLVGASKSSWLGASCALFWVIVVQTTTGVPPWSDAATFSSLLAGSAAILGIAHWSGLGGSLGTWVADGDVRPAESDVREQLEVIAGAIAQFDDWLESHRFSADAWPSFDEFIRSLLYTQCGATHTRPYRILSEGESMVPLRTMESAGAEELASARKGILGHVATTGRSYYSTDTSQGELVMTLAVNTKNPPAWCFAIRQGARSIGLVSVGQLGDAPPSPAMRRALELLIGQFWATLGEVRRGRSATTTEPVSGLMTREALLDEAQRVAEESYAHGEPVAMVVMGVEGLRTLLDQGRWDLANDVVHDVSVALRDRVRPDDLLGRYDDTRFLLMLRGVDSELASLIAKQYSERVAKVWAMEALPVGAVGIGCGVSGSGTGSPSVAELTADAVRFCQRAREREVPLASDVGGECAASGDRQATVGANS